MSDSRIAVVLALALAAPAWAAGREGNVSPAIEHNLGENIALGKKYTMARPNYALCTDPGDATQLTDGEYTRGYFWTQKTTVGWSHGAPRFISVDLGQAQPIRGVSFSTAAGVAGVEWPAALVVFVSADGTAWHAAGDLVELSARKSEPPTGRYATHVFWTDELATHGRFLQIAAVPQGPYLFVDEIEVYRGDASLLGKPHTGPAVASVESFMAARQVSRLIQAQLRRDLDAVEDDLRAPGLPEPERAALSGKAKELAQRIHDLPPVSPKGFRAVLPMTELEREIFRLQAAVWRAQGKPPVRLWKGHRWDPLAPSQEPPPAAPPPAIDVRMMSNEFRADVLNITNARDADARFRLRVDGLPGGPNPDYLAVHEVLTVGTRHFVAVSAALPPASRDGQDYVITVPAGMTRQVWLGFHPTDIKAGVHEGRVVLDDGSGEGRSAPIRLQVFPLRFPDETTLCLGGWSYTNAESVYGVTPRNRDLVIQHLREHRVNAPWATSASLPVGTYDADGNLTGKPDTRNFDEWVARWRGAKRYMVFVALGDYGSVRSSFAGSPISTALFRRKVANWIRFWAQHLRDLGPKASQLGLLLVDEPHEKQQYDVITAWAKVIQETEPEVILWEDAVPREHETCLEMMSCVDVLVPNRRQWLTGDEAFRELFLRQQREGRELGLYSCDGPARCFDPFSYYLLQHWHCFEIGAKWSGFWAFGDSGGASCWNEYLAEGNGPYCPIYLDETSVTGAKYMEAIREGVQDYEYLVTLRDRVAELERAGRAHPALSRAKALLAGACQRVLKGERGANYRWDEDKDRGVADAVRAEILDVLTELAGKAD